MEIPDLQKYKDRFTQKGFVEKISKIAKRAGANLFMQHCFSTIH